MTNKQITIEDNFLDIKAFDELQNIIMGASEPVPFPWYYNNLIDYEDDVNKFQFIHQLFMNLPTSNSLYVVTPILQILQSVSVYRIKANLLTRTPKIVENQFHTDMGALSIEKQNQWTTSIFYINTNNGYTKFKDGTIVESIANRMVTFPSDLPHTGTSCTDEKTRVVINFNYFK